MAAGFSQGNLSTKMNKKNRSTHKFRKDQFVENVKRLEGQGFTVEV
jgi:hypothetical protein